MKLIFERLLSHIFYLLHVPIDWMVAVPETFWLFGSGTPPWPSSRDWTANTVWLSIPEEDKEEDDDGGGTEKQTHTGLTV